MTITIYVLATIEIVDLMNKQKPLCRLSLSYGTLSDSSWIEARSSEFGFTVIHWAEEIIPEPLVIGNIKDQYDWRLFCNYLMNMSDGFIVNDAWQSIDVIGESGLRADCLRIAWSYSYAQDDVLDWLLSIDEDSFNFIDSNFKVINKPDDYELLDRIAELMPFNGSNNNIVYLLESNGLEKSRDSIESLIEHFEYEKSIKEEQKNRVRRQAIEPFSNNIDEISNLFSDAGRRIGCGMSGGKPSIRVIVRGWLENYVVEHGYMPEGEHKVYIPFLGGCAEAGCIDFSNLPEKH